MSRVLWCVVLLVSAGLGTGARAATVHSTSYSYYTVSGSTPAEIYRAILKRGPQVDGAKALASTAAVVEQDGGLAQGPSSCRVSDYKLKLRFTVRLPRIANEAVLPPADRKLWREFSAFLKGHELHHTDLWLSCAGDLERQVTSLREKSCAQATRKVNTLWKRMFARCDKLQAAFDAEQRSELVAQPFMQKVMRSRR